MNWVKRIIPGKVKTKIKFRVFDLLKVPYSRTGMPLSIINSLNNGSPINYIDIGANVGHFSEGIVATCAVKKGVIVEPLKVHYDTLKQKFNNSKTFKIYDIALSEKNGTADFHISEDFDSVSSLLEIYHESAQLKGLNISKPTKSTVITRTLDSICDENFNGEKIDLIKIDVQGAEHLILKSGIETIKKTHLIFTEFSYQPLYEGSSTFYDLYNFMYQHNFILVDVSKGYVNEHGELLQGDALFRNKNL